MASNDAYTEQQGRLLDAKNRKRKPKPKPKRDPKAIQLLTAAQRLMEKYKDHVLMPLDPDEENYRYARGSSVQEEIEDLLKEEREGWLD